MPGPSSDLHGFLENRREIVLARLDRVQGSSPREAGAWMVIAPDAIHGTIGGGRLEYKVVSEARLMLSRRVHDQTLTLEVPLGPEIGQCCGGRVSVSLTRLDERRRAEVIAAEAVAHGDRPAVYIFGAGHVGRALAAVLTLMPVRCVLVDTRAGELAQATDGVGRCLTAIPENIVRDAAPNAAFLVMTHDHGLDFLITAEALARTDALYAGMIGSQTKRAVFEQWHCKTFGRAAAMERLACPIGANPTEGSPTGQTAGRDKRPQTIALMMAAELMTRLAPAVAGTESERVRRHER